MRPRLRLAPCLVAGLLVVGCNQAPPSQIAVQEDAATVAARGAITIAGNGKIQPNGTFRVTVSDADPNVDPASPDAVFVYVTSTTSAAPERAVLVETGPATGLFVGDVAIALADAPVAGDGVVQVKHGDTVTVTYRDQNVGACASGFVTATTTVDAYSPNLYIDPLQIPTVNPIAGTAFPIDGVVRNQAGAGSTAGASVVRAVLGNVVSDWEGTYFETAAVLGTASVPALAPGGTYAFHFDGVIPAGLNGSFTVQIVADATYVVPEYDELDNVISRTVGVIGADLTLEGVSATATVVGGQPLQVTGTVRNLPGGAAAGASTVQVVLGREYTDYDGTYFETAAVIGAASVPALPAGDGASFTVTGTVPANLNGGYTVRVIADSRSVVAERNEGNNFADRAVTVVGADLMPEALSASPSTVASGAPIHVTGQIRNVAGGAAAGASTVRVVLGRELVDWDGTYFETTGVIGTASIPALAAGDAAPFSVTGTIPANLNGAYVIRVIADAAYAVTERDEWNDYADVPITVVGPDLVLAPITVTPNVVLAGGAFQVSGQVGNPGEGASAGPSTLRVVVGRLIRDPWEGDYWDPYIAVANVAIPSIAPGGASSFDVSAVAPAGLTGGYTVLVCADTGGVVVERNETNNCVEAPITVIGPDLLVQSVSAPAEASVGTTIPIAFTVANAADGANAGASQTRIAIGRLVVDPWEGDYWDPYIVIANVPTAALAPGNGTPGTVQWTVPAGLSGTYTLFVTADAAGAVPEHDEGNNGWSGTVTIR